MDGRFKPGDHLRVRRPQFYYHHGIYVSDDRVIQLGRGIFDKPRAAIEAVSLEAFEAGTAAEVVRHGYATWYMVWHPPADEPWKVAARAEFLLKLEPKLKYNLIGHNCEHIANMCVSGGWTESYQARSFFLVRALMSMGLLALIASRSRAKLPIPGWVFPVAIAGVALSVGVKFTYDDQIRRFWNEIRDDWRAHERMLAEDPRNGLTG
jgi:Lecithin retinol acyltransferase